MSSRDEIDDGIEIGAQTCRAVSGALKGDGRPLAPKAPAQESRLERLRAAGKAAAMGIFLSENPLEKSVAERTRRSQITR
jgi:hypothetical protein